MHGSHLDESFEIFLKYAKNITCVTCVKNVICSEQLTSLRSYVGQTKMTSIAKVREGSGVYDPSYVCDTFVTHVLLLGASKKTLVRLQNMQKENQIWLLNGNRTV